MDTDSPIRPSKQGKSVLYLNKSARCCRRTGPSKSIAGVSPASDFSERFYFIV